MKLPILVQLVCFIPACAPAPAPAQYVRLEPRTMEVDQAQSIFLQVDHGEVQIMGGEGRMLQVDGQALSVEGLDYQVYSTDNIILIKALAGRNNRSNPPLRLEVHVPGLTQVEVETDSASVRVRDHQGDLEVDTTSGNILIENMVGRLTLWSNRGNITVQGSSGVISVVGNYGVLKISKVHGETGVSTIMGDILFDGAILAGDRVRLETDHGPVSVDLGSGSDLKIEVRSTSGDVACMLPDIASSARSCEGRMGTGAGSLIIRTVSGPVRLRWTPGST